MAKMFSKSGISGFCDVICALEVWIAINILQLVIKPGIFLEVCVLKGNEDLLAAMSNLFISYEQL